MARLNFDGSEEDFFRFINEYWSMIQRYIPGNFNYEYDSTLYMLPVHSHLELLVAELPKHAKVLDLGCGRGHYTAYLSQRGLNAVGIEVRQPKDGDDFLHNQDKSVLKRYRALWKESSRRYGGKLGYFDGRRLPFAKESLDAVLFYATYEHIPLEDIAFVTAEVFRVLKPGGRVYIFRCPSAWAWKEHLTRRLGMGAHEKLYGKSEIKGLLTRAGFEITRFERSDFFPAHVGPWQGWINHLARPLIISEKLLRLTPLAYFFHHFEITALKKVRSKLS